jgi:hypothetical protein
MWDEQQQDEQHERAGKAPHRICRRCGAEFIWGNDTAGGWLMLLPDPVGEVPGSDEVHMRDGDRTVPVTSYAGEPGLIYERHRCPRPAPGKKAHIRRRDARPLDYLLGRLEEAGDGKMLLTGEERRTLVSYIKTRPRKPPRVRPPWLRVIDGGLSRPKTSDAS